MKTTLTTLVDEIIQILQEHPDSVPSESGIRRWLAGKGVSPGDIDTAMKLVQPRLNSMLSIVNSGPGTVRQLSSYESYKLSKEAHAALNRLELYELMDPFERELILERLDQFEGEVGMSELEHLITWVMCSHRDVEHQQIILSVLEGKTENLH
jgi:uncharacterized protein Smg (DUF494 family)